MRSLRHLTPERGRGLKILVLWATVLVLALGSGATAADQGTATSPEPAVQAVAPAAQPAPAVEGGLVFRPGVPAAEAAAPATAPESPFPLPTLAIAPGGAAPAPAMAALPGDPSAVFLTTADDPMGSGDPGVWFVFADALVRKTPREDGWILGCLNAGFMVTGDVVLVQDTNLEWLRFAHEGREAYLPLGALYRVHPTNRGEGDLPIGTEIVNRWWGLPSTYEPSDLQAVPPEYTISVDRTLTLRREAVDAFMAMADEAADNGLQLRALSAYRDWWYQKDLYLRAVTTDGVTQRHTAPPGHSEHQLGTTVDLTDGGGAHMLSHQFDKTREGQWLEANAARFGWVRSYTEQNAPQTGYIPEPWHYRYVGPDRAQAMTGTPQADVEVASPAQ